VIYNYQGLHKEDLRDIWAR